MAEVATVITDAVCQTDVSDVGIAPAMNLGNVYQTSSHSTGLMFENAVGNQNQQYNLSHSGTAKHVRQLYNSKKLEDAFQLFQQLKTTE